MQALGFLNRANDVVFFLLFGSILARMFHLQSGLYLRELIYVQTFFLVFFIYDRIVSKRRGVSVPYLCCEARASYSSACLLRVRFNDGVKRSSSHDDAFFMRRRYPRDWAIGQSLSAPARTPHLLIIIIIIMADDDASSSTPPGHRGRNAVRDHHHGPERHQHARRRQGRCRRRQNRREANDDGGDGDDIYRRRGSLGPRSVVRGTLRRHDDS